MSSPLLQEQQPEAAVSPLDKIRRKSRSATPPLVPHYGSTSSSLHTRDRQLSEDSKDSPMTAAGRRFNKIRDAVFHGHSPQQVKHAHHHLHQLQQQQQQQQQRTAHRRGSKIRTPSQGYKSLNTTGDKDSIAADGQRGGGGDGEPNKYLQTGGGASLWTTLRDRILASQFFEDARQPTGPKRRQWHFIVFISIIYNAISIPLRVGFTEALLDEDDRRTRIIMMVFLIADILSDFVLAMHMMLSFYTPFEEAGIFVTHHEQVFAHYLFGDLWIDLLATAPLYLADLTSLSHHALWRLPRFIWLRKVGVFFEIWEESVESATSHFRYQFVKLLVVFLLLTHWVASAFMCLAFVKDFDSHWLPPSSIADAGLLQQYVLAFYRSMDMITGGPQDPTDLDEQLFLIVVMIVSVFFVAIIIGSMADIVAQLNERDEAYRKKMDEIHMFCDDRRLPPDLTSRIKKHVSNWWKRKGGLQDSDVLQYLTPSLKNEVNVLLNEDIIQKCPLFQDCPDGFVHNLVSRLKPQLYSPGDVIVKNGDVGHEMYFVGRGECQILQKGKVLGTLTSGDYFGEIALLEANSTRTATIVAKGFCDLFVLQNTDFNKVTRIYPEQLARMQYQAALRRSRSALVAALHKVPDFDHVPERDKLIKALVSRFKPLAAEWMSGDTIFDTLDIANTLYFIGQGLVEIRSRKRVPVSSETQSARDIALLHKSAAVFNSKEKQSITEKIYANIKGELIGVLGQSEFFGWIDTAAHTHGVSNLFEWVHTHSADMDFDQFSKEYKTAVLRNDRRDMHMIHRENLGQGNTSHSFNVHAIIGDECHVDGVGIKVVVLCITATDIDEILEEFEVCESHVIDFVHSFSTEASYNKRTYSEQKQGGMKEMHNNPFVMRLARMYEEGKRDNFALFSLADKRFIHDYIRKISGLIVDGMSEQVENAEGAQGD